MSKYTTGEIAKLCGVSVRTVQYYDERGILVPSELTEGGRRLYSEEDLKLMKTICFLRDLDVSIKSIGDLLSEEDPSSVISLLISEQEKLISAEISEKQKKLDTLDEIKKGLKNFKDFSVNSIGDIAVAMENNKKLRNLRLTMVLSGIPVTALQWVSIILWATKGIWWLFVLWVLVAIPWGIWVSRYYFKKVDYICPKCNEVFKPRFKEVFWANHTPTLRKLTCPKCNVKSFCVETYHLENK